MPNHRHHLILAWLSLAALAFPQTSEVSITNPKPTPLLGPILTPFHVERRAVSQAKLSNSGRLNSLIRAGNLYLSSKDVIALALENNLDIAIQRYGPYLAREVLRRAQAGASSAPSVSPSTQARKASASKASTSIPSVSPKAAPASVPAAASSAKSAPFPPASTPISSATPAFSTKPPPKATRCSTKPPPSSTTAASSNSVTANPSSPAPTRNSPSTATAAT